MHQICAIEVTIWALTLKGRGCILDHGDRETKVARHPRRRRHAVVGGKTDYYECLDSVCAKMHLKIGPNKGAVNVLAENRFADHWQRLDLEGVARRVCAKWRLRFKRQMLDVNDRPVGGAPGRKQIGDPLLCGGIVPRPPARVVKTLLHVDEE